MAETGLSHSSHPSHTSLIPTAASSPQVLLQRKAHLRAVAQLQEPTAHGTLQTPCTASCLGHMQHTLASALCPPVMYCAHGARCPGAVPRCDASAPAPAQFLAARGRAPPRFRGAPSSPYASPNAAAASRVGMYSYSRRIGLVPPGERTSASTVTLRSSTLSGTCTSTLPMTSSRSQRAPAAMGAIKGGV